MAFAWYHYLLYDEALSKILRIIEMAVKQRCRQLQIDLTAKRHKRGHEAEEKRPLKQLMDDLIKAESEKDLALQFEVARSLRNSLMHPERHSYAGAMSKSYIKQSITLLNTLFLPSTLFAGFTHHLQSVKQKLQAFQIRPLVLEIKNNRILIEAAVCIDNKWHYLLACYPVMLNAVHSLKTHNYMQPLCYYIDELFVFDEKIEASSEDGNTKLVVTTTSHAHNLMLYQNWVIKRR